MGMKTRHVHTSDDRDPLRKIPERMPDRDGKWKVLTEKELKDLGKHVGMPYVHVPDPFGCCKSWAEHFNNVWLDGVKVLGVEVEDYSNDVLYREGRFRPPMRTILSDIPLAKEMISKFQMNTPDDYVPFSPICENCGRITAKAMAVIWTTGRWTTSASRNRSPASSRCRAAATRAPRPWTTASCPGGSSGLPSGRSST